MKVYQDLNENHTITHYQISSYNVIVWFRGKKAYAYSNSGEAGEHHVRKMKKLAEDGKGLNDYIQENVWSKYDR